MLSNASLQDSFITVSYYFPEFNKNATDKGLKEHSLAAPATTETSTERDTKANMLVSGWIVSGVVLTEQLVATGISLL